MSAAPPTEHPVHPATRTTVRKASRDEREAILAQLRASGIRRRSPWRIVFSIIGGIISLGVIGLVLALVVVPMGMNGQALTVLSGSMEPHLNPGDVAVVRGVDQGKVCSSIKVGQVVSYFPKPNNPELITHRVIDVTNGAFPDGTTCRITVKGDNNNVADAPISPKQVRGVVMYSIPEIGWVINWAQNDRMTLIIGVAVLFCVVVVWSLVRPNKRRIITTVETFDDDGDEGHEAGDESIRPRPEVDATPRYDPVPTTPLSAYDGYGGGSSTIVGGMNVGNTGIGSDLVGAASITGFDTSGGAATAVASSAPYPTRRELRLREREQELKEHERRLAELAGQLQHRAAQRAQHGTEQ